MEDERKILYAFSLFVEKKSDYPEWVSENFGDYKDFKREILLDVRDRYYDFSLSRKEFGEEVIKRIEEGIVDSDLMEIGLVREMYGNRKTYE